MSPPLVLPLPGAETMAEALVRRLGAEPGVLETRRFPDGESYVRLRAEVAGRDVALVCTLADPDPQILRLIFAARTCREAGAARLTLVAPYLAYMRQDQAFQPGEAVSARQFAALISAEFDRLVTVDPHLHRIAALSEVYSIPAQALHAAPLMAAWIRDHVREPLIIGPDSESAQWARAIAGEAPCVVLEKERRGDRDVALRFPDLAPFAGRRAVLVDDIASSGRTLIEACEGLARRGFAEPVCVVVHAVFAGDAFARLSAAAGKVVSTDTIPHPSNRISTAALIAEALAG